MIALAAIIAVALAGSLGVNAWLIYQLVSAVKKESTSEIDAASDKSEIARQGFELTVTKRALAATQVRAQWLEEELARSINNNPNADLDPADTARRVRRIAQLWRESQAGQTGNPLPATSDGSVPEIAPSKKA